VNFDNVSNDFMYASGTSMIFAGSFSSCALASASSLPFGVSRDGPIFFASASVSKPSPPLQQPR
jgi:hypothetical protein